MANSSGQEKALHTVPRGYMILHRQTYSGIHLYSRPQTTPKTTQAGNPFFQHLWLRYSSRRLGRMRIAGWPLTYLSRDGGQRGKYRTRNGISAFVYALLPSHTCYLQAKVQHQERRARVGAAVAELSLMEEHRVKEKHASPRTRVWRA